MPGLDPFLASNSGKLVWIGCGAEAIHMSMLELLRNVTVVPEETVRVRGEKPEEE